MIGLVMVCQVDDFAVYFPGTPVPKSNVGNTWCSGLVSGTLALPLPEHILQVAALDGPVDRKIGIDSQYLVDSGIFRSNK